MTAKADAQADVNTQSESEDKEIKYDDRKSVEIIHELREEAKKRRLDLKANKAEYESYKTNMEEKLSAFENEKKELSEKIENLSSYKSRLIVSEVKAHAIMAGIKDSDLIKLIDMSDIKIAEDGTVDSEAIQKKVDSLKESKPFLFGEDKKFSTSSGTKIEKKSTESFDATKADSQQWKEKRKQFLSTSFR